MLWSRVLLSHFKRSPLAGVVVQTQSRDHSNFFLTKYFVKWIAITSFDVLDFWGFFNMMVLYDGWKGEGLCKLNSSILVWQIKAMRPMFAEWNLKRRVPSFFFFFWFRSKQTVCNADQLSESKKKFAFLTSTLPHQSWREFVTCIQGFFLKSRLYSHPLTSKPNFKSTRFTNYQVALLIYSKSMVGNASNIIGDSAQPSVTNLGNSSNILFTMANLVDNKPWKPLSYSFQVFTYKVLLLRTLLGRKKVPKSS